MSPSGITPRPLFPRLRASLEGPIIDAELAEGISPSASPQHRARADRMRRPRIRRRIAAALRYPVEQSTRQAKRYSPSVLYAVRAIRRLQRDLLALADLVATLEDASPRGLAIVHQLAFDGRGALFFQPHRRDGVERLWNTIQTARSALMVSADFGAMPPADATSISDGRLRSPARV